MKKLILSFALLGVFTFATPKVTNANVQPCATYRLDCGNGSKYNVVICDDADKQAWEELLC